MMSVTRTFLSPLIHQLLACKMSKNDVVKISQLGLHSVVSAWTSQCQHVR